MGGSTVYAFASLRGETAWDARGVAGDSVAATTLGVMTVAGAGADVGGSDTLLLPCTVTPTADPGGGRTNAGGGAETAAATATAVTIAVAAILDTHPSLTHTHYM